MKKKLTALLSLLLALLMLAGCSLQPTDLGEAVRDKLGALSGGDSEHNPDGVMFSDMRYTRPDTEALYTDIDAVQQALDGGSRLKKVEELLDVCMDAYYTFSTMYALCNIFNCRDLRDEYYADEYEWISAESAEVSRRFDELYYACAGSSLGRELEEDYFWEGFCEDYADPNDSYYNDVTVALMQQESDLISRYRSIVADPVILFEGEEQSFLELSEELLSDDGYGSYTRYLSALMTYYETYSVPLADVYIELMRVRGEMAEAMGFDGVEAMEFDFGFDRDYSPSDAAVFVSDVKTHLVPIYRWAEDEGVSYSVNYSSLNSDELFDDMRSVAGQIGGSCAEAFAFMSRYGLYDIAPSPYKADTSFQTYLDDYESPFIFLNPNGTTSDLLTFVHEFGHFTDAYVNFDAAESIDLAETFSQSLEFLSLSHMDQVLSDREIRQLRHAKMYDALDTFIQQCAFADFESKAHAIGPDALDADKLCELALQSARDFGFCSEGFESYIQYYWMDITHLYEYPFYVISYPVSLAVSMEIYGLELEESGKGLEKYFEIMPRDYDTFMETVRAGGLDSPFAKGSMAAIADMIGDTLGYDGSDSSGRGRSGLHQP